MRTLTAILVLLAALVLVPAAQAQSVYYIDIVSGSNSNNGTSTSTPWKSHPYMQQGAGCGGVTHAYMHVAGDVFIFKGGTGETWPNACFPMKITSGGTASVQDYYGACGGQSTAPAACGGVTWPTSGFTKPKWDGQQTGPEFFVQGQSGDSGYHTFDDFEVANQGIVLYSGVGNDFEAFNFQYGYSGTILNHLNVHDWVGTTNIGFGYTEYSMGGVLGAPAGHADPAIGAGVRILNSTFSDQNGFFYSGGTKITGVPFGGACRNCAEIAGSTFSYTIAACFSTTLCHDSEFSFGDTGGIAIYDGNIHSQVIEDDDGGTSYNYSDYFHDNKSAVLVDLCPTSSFFNNAIKMALPWSGATTNSSLIVDTNNCNDAGPSNIYNNTFDGTALSGASCIRFIRAGSTIGTVNEKNNIQLNCTDDVEATITHWNHSNNYPMGTTEATNYGFVSTNKYSPSSSDPHTVGQGANLTSSCTGNLIALCTDPSGAPWFGGSGKARGSSFDIGAFQFQGGATGPPSLSIVTPSPGNVSGTLNLTATCTPQGAATCTSVQYYIDGFAYGAAQTVSPYTLAWNTNTASNARAHVITAVATDSNAQTGTAAAVGATPTNSHPNGFVSDTLWSPNIPNLSITSQSSGSVTYAGCIRPYTTTNNDNEVGPSGALPTGYGDFAAIIAVRAGGYIQVYQGTGGVGYTTDAGPTAYPVSAGTQYCFNLTVNMTAHTYTVAETSPSVVTIATGFGFRASPTSINFISAYASSNSTPDTVEVTGFSTPATPALSFSPGNMAYGNVVATMTSTMVDSVTIANPNATITSAVVAGTGFAFNASSTCPYPSGTISASCHYDVDFTPSAAGSYSGTLTVTGNQSGSPQVFNLTGTGVASSPSISCSPSSLNLGSVRLANPPITVFAGPITCTITNPPATFTSVATSGGNSADFGVSANSCTGTVSASTCNITASFSPSLIGSEATTLVITATGVTGSPQNIALTGVGLIPAPPVAPSNSMFMASVKKLFQIPLTVNGLSLGTVPFNAIINFTCTDCDTVKQTCASCVAQ